MGFSWQFRGMPQINRQMLVYAVVGGVLLVGFNSIRGEVRVGQLRRGSAGGGSGRNRERMAAPEAAASRSVAVAAN